MDPVLNVEVSCDSEGRVNEKNVLRCVEYIYTAYGTESTIGTFVSKSTISSLYTRGVKAYDWSHPPEEEYYFTWKPDGERFWYIRYGSFWFFSAHKPTTSQGSHASKGSQGSNKGNEKSSETKNEKPAGDASKGCTPYAWLSD